MEVANPLLESFKDPLKACMTNPAIPRFVQTFGLPQKSAKPIADIQYPPHNTVPFEKSLV